MTIQLSGIPKPFFNESLASWIQRVCQVYDLTLDRFHETFSTSGGLDPDLCLTSEQLLNVAKICNLRIENFRIIQDCFCKLAERQPLQKLLLTTSKDKYLYRFCPQCWSEDKIPYFRIEWRFRHGKYCLKHQSELRSGCPCCGKALAMHRALLGGTYKPPPVPDLATCLYCRANLRAPNTHGSLTKKRNIRKNTLPELPVVSDLPPARRGINGCLPPLPDESFSSWAVRVSVQYSVPYEELIRMSLGESFVRQLFIDADIYLVNNLAKILAFMTGIAAAKFESMFHIGGKDAYWPSPEWLVANMNYGRARSAFCRKCLESDQIPYFRLTWRYISYEHCTVHDIPLTTLCPHCTLPVAPIRHHLNNESEPSLLRYCPLCSRSLTSLITEDLQQQKSSILRKSVNDQPAIKKETSSSHNEALLVSMRHYALYGHKKAKKKNLTRSKTSKSIYILDWLIDPR